MITTSIISTGATTCVVSLSLKSAVDAFVANSLHNWMSFDQVRALRESGFSIFVSQNSLNFSRLLTSIYCFFWRTVVVLFQQAELETLHELKAISLKSFLKVIGPTIDQIEGSVHAQNICAKKVCSLNWTSVATEQSDPLWRTKSFKFLS